MKENISTTSGNVDCGALWNSCGLVGVVWPGEVGVGNPIAIDFPNNNAINFAGATPPPTTFFARNLAGLVRRRALRN